MRLCPHMSLSAVSSLSHSTLPDPLTTPTKPQSSQQRNKIQKQQKLHFSVDILAYHIFSLLTTPKAKTRFFPSSRPNILSHQPSQAFQDEPREKKEKNNTSLFPWHICPVLQQPHLPTHAHTARRCSCLLAYLLTTYIHTYCTRLTMHPPRISNFSVPW